MFTTVFYRFYSIHVLCNELKCVVKNGPLQNIVEKGFEPADLNLPLLQSLLSNLSKPLRLILPVVPFGNQPHILYADSQLAFET